MAVVRGVRSAHSVWLCGSFFGGGGGTYSTSSGSDFVGMVVWMNGKFLPCLRRPCLNASTSVGVQDESPS